MRAPPRLLRLSMVAVAITAACSDRTIPTALDETPAPALNEGDSGAWGEYGDDPLPPITGTLEAVAENASDGVIANPSFEGAGTCSYTGWTLWEGPCCVPNAGTWGLATNGQTVLYGARVFDYFDGSEFSQYSPGLPHTYVATDGDCVALQLQNSAQHHRMFQDLTLPSVATMIEWDMEYTNHWGSYIPGMQELAVTVRDPTTDAVLADLFRTIQGTDPQSISMTAFSGDVSTFAGQTVRLSVDMFVWRRYFDAAFDNFRFPIINVDIDIKPGSDPNCFNNNGNGVIPVAVLGTPDFDVTQIDPETVALEGMAVAARGKSNHLLARMEDVNADGIDDLVVQIEDVDGTLQPGDGSATLFGNLFEAYGGTQIAGTDAICVVP